MTDQAGGRTRGDWGGDGDTRPVPDPTVLTTEQLHREIGAVQEMTKALLARAEAITDERFQFVAARLDLIERQRVEQKADTREGVNAALTAQKEAVAKSEAGTARQLEQLNATFATAIRGVTDSLDDVKERVGRIENIKQGGKETISGIYALAGFLVTILVLGGVLAAVGAFN